MGVGKGFRSISVQVLLLIPLAIQGLAPDLYTLASLRGLYVLCQIPVPLDSSERNADQNEDSVCGPIGHSGIVESLEALGRSPRSELDPKSVRTPLVLAARFLTKMILGSALPGDHVCASHCRLTC
jgi:hypothetical protein